MQNGSLLQQSQWIISHINKCGSNMKIMHLARMAPNSHERKTS